MIEAKLLRPLGLAKNIVGDKPVTAHIYEVSTVAKGIHQYGHLPYDCLFFF
jgi:hypothetical protein